MGLVAYDSSDDDRETQAEEAPEVNLPDQLASPANDLQRSTSPAQPVPDSNEGSGKHLIPQLENYARTVTDR